MLNENYAPPAILTGTKDLNSSSVNAREVPNEIWKRGFDLGGALFILLCVCPLFIVVAAIVALAYGRPIFYKHSRIGQGGRPFQCLKFRTMVNDSDKVLRDHLDGSSDAQVEWATTRKLKSDPRVPYVGRVLRKSSIDELPQLINVIRGEMSLVGPRPIVDEEIRHYGCRIKEYELVKPGLTGLWQVGGRSDLSYESRVRLDCEYIARLSLKQDLVILCRTVPAVLMSRGSY